MNELLGDYETFIATITNTLPQLGIDRSELSMMDHICYRVESLDRYEELKKLFADKKTFLKETLVSGRPISTFEFEPYLQVEDWTIPYLELPAPKERSIYKEGLEHAELVVIGSLDRFIRSHANLPFNNKSVGKPLNPELGLKIAGISVKFHEQQLGSVVRSEQRLKELGIYI